MQNKNQLAAQLELVSTLEMLAHAYEEVSVIRMQKVRDSVLKNRTFMEKLAEIFYNVKESYREEILHIVSKKNKGKQSAVLSAHQKNGRTVYLFISSNQRLYGDIVKKVFVLFLDAIKKDPNADIAIAGKLGKDLFEQQYEIKKEFTYFEVPDNKVQIEDLKPMVQFLLPYDKVNVFYGQFNNLVNQGAQSASVTGDAQYGEVASNAPVEKKYTYFFEPSLEKVLNFFESQVFASLLKQTVHEGELARLASRVKAMESALGNIEKEEKFLKSEMRKLKKLTENKKRLEALAGVAMWS
jgi:ATP synthase F1 gamma subunit